MIVHQKEKKNPIHKCHPYGCNVKQIQGPLPQRLLIPPLPLSWSRARRCCCFRLNICKRSASSVSVPHLAGKSPAGHGSAGRVRDPNFTRDGNLHYGLLGLSWYLLQDIVVLHFSFIVCCNVRAMKVFAIRTKAPY